MEAKTEKETSAKKEKKEKKHKKHGVKAEDIFSDKNEELSEELTKERTDKIIKTLISDRT